MGIISLIGLIVLISLIGQIGVISLIGLKFFWSEGDFAADVGVEAGGYCGGGEAKAEEIHQFCDGCFGGHVVAGDYACVGEFVACNVAAMMDTAVDTLGDIYNHYAALDRLSDFLDEPT